MIEITDAMIDVFHQERNAWLCKNVRGGYYESNRAGMIAMLKDEPLYEDGVQDVLIYCLGQLRSNGHIELADLIEREYAGDVSFKPAFDKAINHC